MRTNRLDLAAGTVGWARRNSGSQSIANATDTLATFDTTYMDTHGFAVSTSRIVIPKGMAGFYLVGHQGSFSANGTGHRHHRILHNGTIVSDARLPGTATEQTNGAVLTPLALLVGDYLEIQVRQNSGGALDIGVSTQMTRFWGIKL